MKIIEVITDEGHVDTILSIAEQYEVVDVWQYVDTNDRQVVRLLVSSELMQKVLDSAQKILSHSEVSRIVVLSVEATIPEKTEPENNAGKTSTSRETLYQSVEKNVRLDRNYVLLVILSTLVASLGMLENNIAVVIGAMVIAPLLGPNIALALGTVLGKQRLVLSAIATFTLGILIALSVAFLLTYVYPLTSLSQELLVRTDVRYSAIALALASGAAAALSLTSGLSTVLVGVMVAVAILPPVAVVGLMLGYQQYDLAFGAFILFAINVVCVNLSSIVIFLAKDIRPRTSGEKRKAKRHMLFYLFVWILLLVVLMYIINVRM